MKVQVLGLRSGRRALVAILLGLSVLALGIASHWAAPAKADDKPPGAASGLGQLTGLLVPGPNVFPPASFSPGAVAGPGYSPFIQIAGSSVVYNAPIVASGDGPFDVTTHTNTGDRVLGIHIAQPPFPSGQYFDSWVDLLLVKGFDAGQPILYLSTEAGDPLAAVLERSTFVPALAKAAYNGGGAFPGCPPRGPLRFSHGQNRPDALHSE